MRKSTILSIIFAGGLMLTSCDDFLDVRPDSQKLESDLYSTPQGLKMPSTVFTVPCSLPRSTARNCCGV